MSGKLEDGVSIGFAAVARHDARVLVLGSLPSRASIAAQQYYAHPRNAFWKIMRDMVDARGSYADRCRALGDAGIALWDVLASSVRPGSLDADIRVGSAVVNDFDSFFRTHRALRLVCFNGRTAEAMFRQLVTQESVPPNLHFACLPSTSPAHAAMSFGEKLRRWRGIIGPDLIQGKDDDRICDTGDQPLR